MVSGTGHTDGQRTSNACTRADEPISNPGLRRLTDAMEARDTSAPTSLLLPATSPLLAAYSSSVKKANHASGAATPQSHGITPGTPVSLRPKGHYRSSSLENNPFHPHGGKPMIGLSIAQASFTGTLKSRREQKRISDFLSKQSTNLGGTGSSGASSLTLVATSREPLQSESSLRKAHFENIREIFEKNNSKSAAAAHHHQQQQQQHAKGGGKLAGPQIHNAVAAMMAANVATPSELASNVGGSASTLGIPIDDKPPKIQACSGILGKGKQVIRPIAFKPVPYKCNTPNYGAPIGGRLTELSDRYGSTPSLGPTMSLQYKFGSTTDLHHLQQQQQGSSGSNGATPVASIGPCSSGTGSMSASIGPVGGGMMSNSYHPHYHHQYSTLTRKGSSTIPFKTYDSLESILKLPDSMVGSYPNPSHGLYHQQDVLDMAPSPSDSGISELEAALRDRDSELAYLRQTMEHNEQVIFKVHQDKEKHWEQELNRLKAIHESRLRAGAQKVHKLEQLLMMQTFQLRQDKKRLQEENARLHTDLAQARDHTEQHKSELGQLRLNGKELKDQNGDLLDEIQMLRRVISDLKERLEESEWNLCQKNGEVALMKTQLKDAQAELSAKDQEIVQLKADMKLQNYDDISLKKSEIKKELDFDLEISQLNRIVIFKDQIIVLMNNEIQKLRKELSDISILRGYEGAPTGRYARYKKKLELVAQKFEESDRNDSNNNSQIANSNSSSNKPTESPCGENHDTGKSATAPSGVQISSSEIIRNYFNSKLEINKKLFLSSQICNYSDEDKSNIIDAYGSAKQQVDMTDITLNLSSLLPNSLTELTPVEQIPTAGGDSYHHQSSSDDDYKSMTPTQDDQEEHENDESDSKGCAPPADQLPAANVNGKRQQDAADELDRLNRELASCRDSFEQERAKWADEKEKVLIYQRQLQKNYVDMSKRTQQLEERLKTLQLQPPVSAGEQP